MATRAEFAEYVAEQLGGVKRGVVCRKLFGEYGLHCYGTFFGIICDDTLYFKPTRGAEALLAERGELALTSPFDGARDYERITCLDDCEFLSELLDATLRELPPPKPRKSKRKAL